MSARTAGPKKATTPGVRGATLINSVRVGAATISGGIRAASSDPASMA